VAKFSKALKRCNFRFKTKRPCRNNIPGNEGTNARHNAINTSYNSLSSRMLNIFVKYMHDWALDDNVVVAVTTFHTCILLTWYFLWYSRFFLHFGRCIEYP